MTVNPRTPVCVRLIASDLFEPQGGDFGQTRPDSTIVDRPDWHLTSTNGTRLTGRRVEESAPVAVPSSRVSPWISLSTRR